jgi:hypothetical protein
MFFLFVGCASQSSKEQLLMRELIEEKNFTAAIEVLEKSDLAKKKGDRVLYHMELGSLHFYQGSFSQAALNWQKALELISIQYTRVSTAVSSTLISDQLKEYQAKDYEISYLYYFQALAFYFEYLKSNDRKFLLQARASIMAWDVFLQNIKIDQKFKNLYFDDFYARFFAGLIHEAIGERGDLEIAYQLYRDAYQLFLLQAPTYDRYAISPDMALKYIEELMTTLKSKDNWREKLKNLANKNLKNENEQFQLTRKLLAQKILMIAKNVRKNEVKKLQKEFDLTKNDGKENGKADPSFNALVLLQDDWMNPLEAKSIRLSLSAAMKDGNATQAVLTAIAQAGFMVFAAKILGNGSSGRNSGHVNFHFYGTGDITELSAGAASLEFEIPDVKKPKPSTNTDVKILYAVKNAETKEEQHKPILVQSFDDIIFQTIERQKALDLMLKGTRFASKHVAAMIGSYALYKGMVASNSKNEGFAQLAAMASYMASAKMINISERADVRYWSLLPARVSLIPITIPAKVEELSVTKPDGSTQPFKVDPQAVTKNKLQILPLL